MPLTDIVWSVDEQNPGQGSNEAGSLGADAAELLCNPGGGASSLLCSLGAPEPDTGGEDFTLVAVETDPDVFGYLLDQVLGSMTPHVFNSVTISDFYSDTGAGQNKTYMMTSDVQAADVFTSIEVNGTTLTLADAAYTANVGGKSRWIWSASTPISAAGTFAGTVNT